jgi:AbiV family abortive infection protein
MAKDYPPLPPTDDLIALFHAARSNARDLLDDAEVLADRGRWPRACALATLGLEEMSKAQLCLLAATLGQLPGEMTPRDFWAGFSSHAQKLARSLAVATLTQDEPLSPFADQLELILADTRSASGQKLSALYVDYEDGQILLPIEVGESAATDTIGKLRQALAYADAAFTPEFFDPQVSTAVLGLVPQIEDAHAADPDALMSALQAAFRDGSFEALNGLITPPAYNPSEPHQTPPDDDS